jgi:hypothetical protein
MGYTALHYTILPCGLCLLKPYLGDNCASMYFVVDIVFFVVYIILILLANFPLCLLQFQCYL